MEEEAEEPFRDFATMRDLALTPRRGSGRAATVDALRWSRLSSRERPSLENDHFKTSLLAVSSKLLGNPCSYKASPCSPCCNSTSATKCSTSRCKCFSSLQNWPVLKQESASPQQERRDGRLFNMRSGRRKSRPIRLWSRGETLFLVKIGCFLARRGPFLAQKSDFFTLHPYNPPFLVSDGPDSMGS